MLSIILLPRGPLWKDARIHPLFSSHLFYVFLGVLLCVDMRLLVSLCVRVYACVGICHCDPRVRLHFPSFVLRRENLVLNNQVSPVLCLRGTIFLCRICCTW